MCWTADQLRGKAAEIKPRIGIKAARIAPPQLDLAPFTQTKAEQRGAIRRVVLPEGKKLIALTFDLCEAAHEVAGYDGRVIDYLREHGVKATLFAGGKWLMTHQERAQQLIADPLFEMANHGWQHANFKRLTGLSLKHEIARAQAAYENVRGSLQARQCLQGETLDKVAVPERMSLMRFPYGICSKQALDAVANEGLLAIQWDIATGDPDPRQSARSIASKILRMIRPGSIILGHANGRGYNAAAALPHYIPALREKGYEFVTVSELLASGVPEIVDRCYDTVAGDTERWITARRTNERISPVRRSSGSWDPFSR